MLILYHGIEMCIGIVLLFDSTIGTRKVVPSRVKK